MTGPAGLYIHFPFCQTLCPYCDFVVYIRKHLPASEYTDALIRDFDVRRDGFGEFKTIYVGGGTPSMWPTEHATRLIGLLNAEYVDEFTVEANPNDITEAWLRDWRSLGASRISLGVQSFDSEYLEQLGRNHDGTTATAALDRALSFGFEVSVDLIYGGPHHTTDILSKDLDTLARTMPHHVSAYELTLEPNTVFSKRVQKGTLDLPSGEALADLSSSVVQRLAAMGFERYEVSSFARSDEFRAQHNHGYWNGTPYLGIGVGAHSFRTTPMIREHVDRDLNAYLRGEHVVHREALTPGAHWFERCFLAVRTTSAIDVDAIADAVPFVVPQETIASTKDIFSHIESLGWAKSDSGRIFMTHEGLDFADSVAEMLQKVSDF